MEFTEIEVGEGKTVVFHDLTITNEGGGHKIQMDRTDLPYANITFQTPRTQADTMMLLSPHRMKEELVPSLGQGNVTAAPKELKLQTIHIDAYTIVVKDIMWDGVAAVLQIAKNQ